MNCPVLVGQGQAIFGDYHESNSATYGTLLLSAELLSILNKRVLMCVFSEIIPLVNSAAKVGQGISAELLF